MLLFLYPTTTAFIDDDNNFLNAIVKQPNIGRSITFNDPNEAVEKLNKANSFPRIEQRIRQNTFEHNQDVSIGGTKVVHFDLSSLYKEIYNKHRYNDIAVIVIDYYMNGMHGIEVCQKLKSLPAKKILLTGGYDKEQLAIQAFNKGLIDKFISKTDPDLTKLLGQSIKILTEAYSNEISKALLPYSLDAKHILNNQNYINFLRSQQLNFNAIEFYILDTSGSCLFLDAEGGLYWLIIKQQEEIDNYKNIAIDQDAPMNLVAKLTNKSKLPFFFEEQDYDASPEKWGNYLLPSRPLPGMPGYFYAIHKGNIRNIINEQGIASFNKK